MSDSRSEDPREFPFPAEALIEVDETVVVAGAAPAAEKDAESGAADEIDAMSYEEARDALLAVVDQLERGGTTLEQSLSLWERGESLAARCETWLIGARARLDAARGAEA
jgi:exodeoxyribonuclease VII small subunit